MSGKSAVKAHRNGLAALLAGVDRVTVVDVETTGLYRTDRIVEIALVTMDPSGNVIDEFETLVNPLRDPGPTWIHGVTASMLMDAPTFHDIADHVAARLHGTVVVAHNLRFDARMIDQEFSRTGVEIDWGSGLDTLRATGCKLGVACAEYDIRQQGSHRALFDARATGQLLFAICEAFNHTCFPVAVRPLHRTPARRVLTRDGFVSVPVDVPYLVSLSRGVHADPDVAAYVTLLDRAVADLRLTAAERDELSSLATELGLGDRHRERAHREFLNGLIDAALEDSIVTDEELEQLCRVAALLNIDAELVSQRTSRYRLADGTITLHPGLHVCFTGAALDELGNPIDRETILEAEARRHGLIPKDACTKSCGLVIAADTASQSSKVKAARRYGTPVAALGDYRRALATGQPLPVTRLASTGVAQVCRACGDSWMVARRTSSPVCPACRGIGRITTTTQKASARQSNLAVVKVVPPAVETLICTACMRTWERARTRGRPPKRCPTCAEKKVEAHA
ncbi:3'-5' exonuclease [Mycobacterium kubicae]|uniref:3'-5' exonuclease n=1 Tax=Mycobacterium kubicae TaxID=120959 RepID=UPI001FD4EA58|nr:3'-5' exonuclease [Mycobacterium kubicae]